MKILLSFLTTFFLCTLSAHAAIVPAHGGVLAKRHPTSTHYNATYAMEHAMEKRGTVSGSKWTYYEAGKGACGGTNNDNDWIVAVDANRFDSGDWCWKTIEMTYNGKTAKAQVVDRCAGCQDGGLDLTPGLFAHFDSTDKGVLYGSWSV